MPRHDQSGSSIELNIRNRDVLESKGPHTSTNGLSLEASASSHIELVNETSLLPVDHGLGAMSFLIAAVFVEGIVIGLPNAFGVFLVAYLENPVLASQPHAESLLPLIGTLSSGIMFSSGPVVFPLFARFPHIKRPFTWVGTALIWVSLFGSSFTTSVPVLILLQGVVYAIGGAMLYGPCLDFMVTWFVNRRGFATGIMFAGASVGGLVFPLVLTPMIKAIGLPWTFRTLSVAIFVIVAPLLRFIKGRLPESRVQGPVPRSSSRNVWMKDIRFRLMIAANTAQALAYYIPIFWLPTFASALNLTDTQASLTVSLLNGASVFGCLIVGYFSDKVDVWLLGAGTLLSSTVTTFIFWGVLGHSFPLLLVFAIAYGGVAGSWSSLWAAFVKPIAKEDPTILNSLLGYLALTRGIGNVLSTPIAAALRRDNGTSLGAQVNFGFNVGGGQFENVIFWAGSCFAGGTIFATIGWAMSRKQ